MKKADAAEEWANALDAAESAAIEGRPEVSAIAVAIATASGHTRRERESATVNLNRTEMLLQGYLVSS